MEQAMSSHAELLLDHARGLVHSSVKLVAADELLETVEISLYEAEEADAPDDLRAEVHELRGIIARDSFDYATSAQHFARALRIARARQDAPGQARVLLAKATAATIVDRGVLARTWLRHAHPLVQSLGGPIGAALRVEALTRTARLLEVDGEYAAAENLYTRRIVPQSLRWEEPGLVSARFSAEARLRAIRGELGKAEASLREAGRYAALAGSVLRDVQWRTALGLWLHASGDASGAEREAIALERLLAVGEFRNAPAERLMARYGLATTTTRAAATLQIGTATNCTIRQVVSGMSSDATHQANSINVGSMHASQIQQATTGSQQSMGADLPRLLEDLERLARALPPQSPEARDLSSAMAAVEQEITRPRPRPEVLRSTLTTVRTVLEGAAGGVLADRAPDLAALLERLAQAIAGLLT